MKTPTIGISSNYTSNDQVGIETQLGFRGQHWQLVADDYVRAISAAGGLPLILPVVEHDQDVKRMLDHCDGLLVTGGNDLDPRYYGDFPKAGLGELEPRRDAFDTKLVDLALARRSLPILGICRGCQVLNVVANGTLYQDIYTELSLAGNHTLKLSPKSHPTQTVRIEPDSKLFEIFQTETLDTNSFNHQASKDIGEGFRVTMRTNTDDLVEGIEMQGERFVVGVQWHPETMAAEHHEYQALFDAFVRACKPDAPSPH